MTNNQNIEKAFVELGRFLSQFTQNGINKKSDVKYNDLFFDGLQHQIKLAQKHNGWFTKNNILFAFEEWSKNLTYSNIKSWLEKYDFNVKEPKYIAIIMAGNIPTCRLS